MKFKQTSIKGAFEIENFVAEDERGLFSKTYHANDFLSHGINTHFKESYYSKSKKDVLRGMHFQIPPHEHEKLVYVTEGEILDVIIDLRQSSPSYKTVFSTKLTAFKNSIYVPSGCAHGFLTLSESATVVYNVSSVYHPDADKGIHWNSFNFDWQINSPIISMRDQGFEKFNQTIFFK